MGQYLLWESGTQRALWLSFQFPRCPPPRAGGSAASRAKARQLANLSESTLEILIARTVARAGATQTKVHFFFFTRPLSRLSFRDPHCFGANLGTPRPEVLCHFALGQGGPRPLWVASGSLGSRKTALPTSPLPPTPPSLFFLALSWGWLDRRGLAPDLWGAPQVFNDSLKVAVGRV